MRKNANSIWDHLSFVVSPIHTTQSRKHTNPDRHRLLHAVGVDERVYHDGERVDVHVRDIGGVHEEEPGEVIGERDANLHELEHDGDGRGGESGQQQVEGDGGHVGDGDGGAVYSEEAGGE